MSALIEGVDRVGRYEPLLHLATGGMAEIHLARMRGPAGFEKLVVLKRILPELASNPELATLFLDEARLAAMLDHPNVVHVQDFGIFGGRYFFSMEFVHGEDARSILRTAATRGLRLSLAEALSIGIGVCAGLHYAHERVGPDGRPLGIIHRDLSPSNVLVSYDGAVKVVDFGIAKAVTRSSETGGGLVRGKASYMSPEQCLSAPLDRRSDVYAIAILLFELTTGRKLYVGANDYEVTQQIVEGRARAPSSCVPDYPPELEEIVRRGLSLSPDDRYATARELQLALEDFARRSMLAVSPVTLAEKMAALFAEKIAAWQQAQRDGVSIEDHLAALLGRAVDAQGTVTQDERPPRTHASGRRRALLPWVAGGALVSLSAWGMVHHRSSEARQAAHELQASASAPTTTTPPPPEPPTAAAPTLPSVPPPTAPSTPPARPVHHAAAQRASKRKGPRAPARSSRGLDLEGFLPVPK